MARVQVNGLELEVEVFNPGGEPLLLIMGLGAQLVHWPRGFCEGLAQEGFEVIRFDNRDIGRSTWLDHLGVPDVRGLLARRWLGLSARSPYSLQDMADDAAGLLTALGHAEAHVVGASMGGMIGQLVALHHPRRVRSFVSIMSSPGSRRHSVPQPQALRALFAPMPQDRAGRIDQAVKLYRVISGPGFPFDEAEARALANEAMDRGYHPQGFMRHFAAIAASPDRTASLRQIAAPTTVIHGTLDPLVRPAAGLATARAIPNARLQWVAGMGHMMPPATWPTVIQAIADNARRATR